ncbi:PepSY-associated TM helix domain-containing protein [Spirosoma litoris]
MQNVKKGYTFRKLINDLHLWLGLPSALILFIMCFTGTIYVFSKEITKWLDSDKFVVKAEAGASAMPIAELLKKVEKEKKGKTTNLTIPKDKTEAWLVVIAPKKKKEAIASAEKPKKVKENVATIEKKEEKEKTDSYLVNPYTGVIQGNAKTPTSEFFATTLQLHRWLLMDKKIGGVITGIAALMMILLQFTGLILWLPAKIKSWKKWNVWETGFKIKTGGNWKRTNFDLHKALGFYSFLFVTIMALTGPYFAFDWYKKGASKALGTKPLNKENPFQSVRPEGVTKPLALEQVVAKINETYPYEGNIRLILSKDSLGSISVQKARTGFLESAAIDRMILDQYSAKTLQLDRYSEKTLGEKIVASAKFIHTGELFGVFSKVFYFIASLIATSLPVSGFLIWWGRRNKSKASQKPVPKTQKLSDRPVRKPVIAKVS